MASIRPVTIPNGAYLFCRTTIAALAWLALLLQQPVFLWVDFAVLVTSAVLTVGRAPLIVLYTRTIDAIAPSRHVTVDEKAIRFAHTVGAALSGVALALLSLGPPVAGWVATGLLALLWTSAAFGYCSAAKLYQCTTETGSCCGAGRLVRRVRHAR